MAGQLVLMIAVMETQTGLDVMLLLSLLMTGGKGFFSFFVTDIKPSIFTKATTPRTTTTELPLIYEETNPASLSGTWQVVLLEVNY